MTHADTAPNRFHFSSAGAVRRPCPTDPPRPTGIQINWANLLDNLAAIDPPHLIGLKADAGDIKARASHAEAVLNVVTSYMRALVGDTATTPPAPFTTRLASSRMPRATSWALCVRAPTGRRRTISIRPAGCGATTPRRHGEGGAT
jgi:hypothetical protein